MKNFLQQHLLVHLHFSISEEIKHTYLFTFIRAILMVSGGIFIPYYILKDIGFEYFILYLLLLSSLFRPVSFLIAYFIAKKGLELNYFISIISFIIQLIILNLFGLSKYSIIILAFFASLSVVIYWFSLNLSIVKFSSKEKTNQERFLISLLISFVKAFFPFFSSLIIALIGFKNFFGLIALISTILTIYLIYFFKKNGKITKVSINIHELKGLDKRTLLFFFEAVFNSLIMVYFAFIVSYYKSVEEFGFLMTLSNLLTIVISFWLSKRMDSLKDYTLAMLGFLFLETLFLHLIFKPEFKIVLLSFLINGSIISLITTPYFGWFFSVSKEKESLLIYREFLLAIGFLVSYGLILTFNLDIIKSLYYLTLAQLLFAVLFYFITKKQEIKDEKDKLVL